MNNIVLNNGDGVTVLDSTNTKAVPIDGEGRGIVNTYEDIVNIRNPYLYMRVIVRNDSQDATHLKGEYIITKLTSIGKVDESGIKSFKDYVGESDPTVPAHVKEITQQNITNWNNKSNFSGDYNDLTNKPTIPDVSNKVDKELGKGLSTNDYDNTEKGKVANAIQTPSATENDKIPVMRNGNIEWENKPSNGKSAYEIWYDENGYDDPTTYNEDYFLASLKAQFGSFVPAEYGTNGKPNDGSNDITPSSSTTNHIYLVDNLSSSPTAKVMWITVVDATDPQNITYSWQNIGTVEVDLKFNSGETINNVNIDDTNLKNVDSNSVVLPKASDVQLMNQKLKGVTLTETKVPVVVSGDGQNVYSGYINGMTGAYASSSYNNFIVVPLNGANRVRFLAKENSSNSSYIGWTFGTFNGDIDATLSNFAALSSGVYANNPLDNQAVEYIKNAPEGATHAVITIWKYKSGGGSAVTFDNFYCYLQSGESVGDGFTKLYSSYDDSIVSETDYASDIVESQYRVILDVDDNSIKCVKRPSSGNSRISWITSEHFEEIRTNGYRKLHIVGHSSRGGRIMFTKKAITSLPSGTNYYFDYLHDNGYLCKGTTADTLYTLIYTSSSGTTDVPIPDDCNYIYVQYSRPIGNTSANCAPSSIIPFSKFVKGDIEKIVDEKIENFTPTIVEDNLNSLSTNNALSANQGRLIGKLIVREHRIIFLDIRTYAVTSGGTWGTSTDYAHAIVSVKSGEKYRIENYDDSSDNIRYAFLTSDGCTAGGDMPLLGGTTVKTVNHNTSDIVTIPDGCKFLTFMKDKPGVSNSYKVRLYKYIYINDKEFFDDYSIFDDSLPKNASAYHEGWNDLVNAGLVERSSPYYMEWDINEDYPIYTYRIQRELEYMVGYNPYHIRKGEATNYYRRKIMITCGIHGSERLTPNSFLKWVKEHINDDIFAACNFVIIPLCNPWGYSHTLLDGSNNQDYSNMGSSSTPSGFSIVENSDSYYYGIRKTRNVSSENSWTDINRDFDDSDGFTSEEAKYIRDVYLEEKPDMVIDFHQDLNSKPSPDSSPTSSNAKCGFINFGPSNVQEIRDKLIECRRKAFTQINKANYATDCYVNKYFANKTGQFSFTWGGIYPDSQSEWSTTHEHNWHNYASGGSGNSLHQDCAVRYSFTAETDVFCKMIGGSGRPNNDISNAYGYIYMTNFLSRIFDVFDMGDLDRPVISNEQAE